MDNATADQIDQVVESITRGLDELGKHVADVRPTVAATIAGMRPPPWVEEALIWCGDRIIEGCTWFIGQVRDALEGAAAPGFLLAFAYQWQSIRGEASTAAGLLKPETMPANGLWNGSAATAYKAAVTPQGAAAGRIATLADKTATALNFSGAAGIAFYVCIAGIVVEMIATTVAALVALGSEVFSWAGIALFFGEFAISRAALIAAFGGLAIALGAQASQLAVLHGEAVDNSTFPGGHWPNPVVAGYADATVTDGDADWSLEAR